MNPKLLSERWDTYLETVRAHAHQLVAWAYEDVRGHLPAHADEPTITGLLAEAMKERINYHPDTPEEYAHYDVRDQDPVSPSGQTGNDRLRLDLVVVRTGIRPSLDYVLEAKRLRTRVFTIGRYVGAEGMGDFIECRYAVSNPEAALIGLFEDKDASYWQHELCRVFREDALSAKPCFGIRSHPTPVSVHPAIVGEFRSDHVRTNSTPICLFHIFLDRRC